MNTSNGFGSNSAPYEYTVAEQGSRALLFKRITLIAVYVLWVAAWLILGAMLRIIAPLLAFIPLSLWILVFLTWRLTQVEYEYSFFSGTLTVCRVLGGRSRRTLVSVSLRELASVYPCDDEHAARIDAYAAKHTVIAAPTSTSDGLYAALWSDEGGDRHALYFRPDETAVKIIRYYNASAISLRKSHT